MCARSKLTKSCDVTFYSQSTSELDQRAMRESNEDSKGERDNYALTKALQTKEQRGCVCGVSSKLTVDISYAAPQAHGIVNVALHQEYSPGIVFIFSQGGKDLYHV
jgi:hypothetical protein